MDYQRRVPRVAGNHLVGNRSMTDRIASEEKATPNPILCVVFKAESDIGSDAETMPST